MAVILYLLQYFYSFSSVTSVEKGAAPAGNWISVLKMLNLHLVVSASEGGMKGASEGGMKGTSEGGMKGTSEGGMKGASEGGMKGASEGGMKCASEGGEKMTGWQGGGKNGRAHNH